MSNAKANSPQPAQEPRARRTYRRPDWTVGPILVRITGDSQISGLSDGGG